MLLGKQCGRHEHDDLFVVGYRNKGSAHRNFRFTKPDVSANQSVHRSLAAHILHHCGYSCFLVYCLFEREAGGKFLIIIYGSCILKTFTGLSRGVNLQKLRRHVMDFFCCFALGLLPLFGTKSVERCVVLIPAAISAYQMKRRDRHVELGLIGIFEGQEFSGLSLGCDSLQTPISTHAMLKMHNGIIHV